MNPDNTRHESATNDLTFTKNHFTLGGDDQEQRLKEEDLYNKLEELVKFGRFVMFSPTKRYVYLMGLIDYLGKWNMSKKFEMYGKTLLAHFIRQNTDFSVKPPHEFARRFLRKVKRVFRVEKVEKRPGKLNFQSMADPRISSFHLDVAAKARHTMLVDENKIEEEHETHSSHSHQD